MTKKKTRSNADYWDLRSGQEQLAKYLRDADDVIRGMEEAYKEIYQDMLRDIEAFYGRVMTEEGFNRHEAEKNIDYGKRHLKELEAFIDHFDAIGGTDPALINQYKAIARANHMTRFELLEAQINANAARLAMVQEERAAEHLQKIAREEYFETMYAEYRKGNPGVLELMTKGGVRISQNTVNDIVYMNWAGANFSDAIWHREFDLADKIKRAVMRNVVQGKSIENCAKELRENLDLDLHYAAERLVRTETAHVHTALRAKTFAETGVKKYKYVANLDARTSTVCADLHGKVFALEEAKAGVNLPPMHPNCRSDIHAEYEEPLIKDKEYRVKMSDGKYKTVPLGMEKEEWMRVYGKEKGAGKVSKKPEKGYNTISGRISGALNPNSKAANEHAVKQYAAIRKRKTDASKIAQNTGYSKEFIQEIKDYLFVDEHVLAGKTKRFDPSFEIAQSWERLFQNKIEPHDLTLLKHEELERRLVFEGYSQDDAHRIASEKHNYPKEADEYYALLEKRKKRRE